MGFKKFKLASRTVNDLKKRTNIGIFFYLLIVFIILSTDQYYIRYPEFSKQFFFSILFLCTFRFIHLLIARWAPEKFEQINRYIFFISLAAVGLVWGIHFAVIMIQPGESQVKPLMVMCSIGVCSGAVVAFTPSFKLAVVYVLFMLVPMIGTLIVHQTNLPLAFSGTLYLLYMIYMAARGSREYWKALENEHILKMASRIDSLTGIYNRRYFNQAFAIEWNRALRHKNPLTIIICDIDFFKKINDDFGHMAGDNYLKGFAVEMTSVFKRKTDITARFGGEEFIVLMGDETGENAFKLAEVFRSKIKNFYIEHENRNIRATVSIGISTCIPDPGDKKEALISTADTALYQSKSDGRNRITVRNQLS